MFVKKLPVIGLIIGAVAVFFAKMRRKKAPAPTTDDTPAA